MKKTIIFVFSVILLISFNNAFSADGTEEAMLADLELIKEYNYFMEGYQSVMEGYEEAMKGDIKSQLDSIIGTTTIGTLYNGETEQDARAWSPSEWAQVVSGGNESRYKELLTNYQAAHPTLSTIEASEGMSSTNVTDYQQQVETNQAASSQATYAFNNSNSHLETINKLSETINEEKDTKRIQDLNARMNAEIAYLQVEVIKGIAVMNQQMAQQQATVIHDKTEAAKFNQIPD